MEVPGSRNAAAQNLLDINFAPSKGCSGTAAAIVLPGSHGALRLQGAQIAHTHGCLESQNSANAAEECESKVGHS
jgi:hypothetical protein